MLNTSADVKTDVESWSTKFLSKIDQKKIPPSIRALINAQGPIWKLCPSGRKNGRFFMKMHTIVEKVANYSESTDLVT